MKWCKDSNLRSKLISGLKSVARQSVPSAHNINLYVASDSGTHGGLPTSEVIYIIYFRFEMKFGTYYYVTRITYWAMAMYVSRGLGPGCGADLLTVNDFAAGPSSK